jgi:hypothetical protein
MSAQAAVFSGFQPKVRRGETQQSIEVSFLDADSWVSEVFQELTELENLPSNWDSYGSAPPKPDALRAARQFLTHVPFTEIPIPSVTAVPGGGVGFHWKVADRGLEIEFLPDGKAEFLKSTGTNAALMEEGCLDVKQAQRNLWKWLGGI